MPIIRSSRLYCVITAYGVQCLVCWLLEVRFMASGFTSRMGDVDRATSLILDASSWFLFSTHVHMLITFNKQPITIVKVQALYVMEHSDICVHVSDYVSFNFRNILAFGENPLSLIISFNFFNCSWRDEVDHLAEWHEACGSLRVVSVTRRYGFVVITSA